MQEAKLTDRGKITRQRIIEATGREILASGIGGTTLDTVRAATLTSKSQLFHYFPGGKAELVREVAIWEAAELIEAQKPHIDDLGNWDSWHAWRDALVAYYIGLGRWACPIGSLATQAAMTDPELDAIITASMTSWRKSLEAGVEQMQVNGHVDAQADPQRIAVAILAALQGGLILSQPEKSAWPLEAAIDSAMDILHRVKTDVVDSP